MTPQGRRRFLGTVAMPLAAARFGVGGSADANQRDPRHLAAVRRATGWLDSPPLSAATLAGRVVLVQFGTYTCINWLRTLPYIRAWNQKYSHGLVVIGVHTPEFAFEKRLENVRRAVQQMNLGFPIAVDNDYAIWRAFDNRYWPALYFIDVRGRLRRQHFGEGEYTQSEMAIQGLLAEAGISSDATFVSVAGSGIEAAADWRNLKSPEIYLGHARTAGFASPGGVVVERPRVYSVPERLALNAWALSGEWTIADQPVSLNRASGRIVCRFHSRDVHLVMGPSRAGRPIRFRVMLDRDRPGSAHGGDVDDNGSGTVTEQRLYQLIRQPGPIVDRTFEIEFLDAGVEAFAFTFG